MSGIQYQRLTGIIPG